MQTTVKVNWELLRKYIPASELSPHFEDFLTRSNSLELLRKYIPASELSPILEDFLTRSKKRRKYLTEYARKFYQRNKERICRICRAKYANDEERRKRLNEYAIKFYHRNKEKIKERLQKKKTEVGNANNY